ncbi:MAG: chromate efflux transporter [Pseudomonadota bacterium]
MSLISDPQGGAGAVSGSPSGEQPRPSFAEAVAAWARIGILSFGGPAGQIALMHRVTVDEKKWLREEQFLPALNFCMLLPGPEAMQLATYIGWRLHGVAGGLAAGLLFVLPGAALIAVLASIYAAVGQVPLVAAVFVGIKAAVLAIVIDALLKVSKRALKGPFDLAIAVAAFVAIFMLRVPFPLIILAAAIAGVVAMAFGAGGRAGVEAARASRTGSKTPPPNVTLSETARTIAIWLFIWIAPLAAMALALGSDHILSQIGLFFSKLAVVTFGGAYAVLAYMSQEVVQNFAWLSSGEMLDSLGLAETTPGPLILVTEFVGFLAAFKAGGWGLAMAAAVVTLWATFAPCFLWIFAGAPYVEWLNAQPRLKAALAAITAAVVGVIANLAVWFGLSVLFGERGNPREGLVADVIARADVMAIALFGLATVLLLFARAGVLTTLGVAAGAALAAHLAGLTIG